VEQAWSWVRSHSWETITGVLLVLGAIGGFILWPFQLRKMRRDEQQELRKEKERLHELEIQKYLAKIKACERELQKGRPSPITLMTPEAEPGEDAAILAEAWELYKKEKAAKPTFPGRFG
jgi:hypothetical protein